MISTVRNFSMLYVEKIFLDAPAKS